MAEQDDTTPVRERPIIFSGPMIRALLAGTKTQTRRILLARHFRKSKRMPTQQDVADCGTYRPTKVGTPGLFLAAFPGVSIGEPVCPYVPGDRLWVRETWAAPHSCDHLKPREIPKGTRIHYAASCGLGGPLGLGGLVARPSIFMPRWASRLTLEVKDVRVQRLQDISEEEAEAEGCGGYVYGHGPVDRSALLAEPGYLHPHFYRAGFEHLWESINGRRAPFLSNPWTWAITFKVPR